MLLQQPAIKSILKGIVLWAPLWIGSTVVLGILGFVYAYFIKEDVYLASQALLVRDEAKGTVMRLGRFESQTQMKAAQETILEMSKNHQVIRDALTQVGPISKGWSFANLFGVSEKYPSDEVVAEFAKYNVSVHAPKGVEFGATEVIYLDIKANTPSIALKLSKSVSTALDARLREVREKRATSIISELEGAKSAARRELESISEKIKELEISVGAQLSDLRNMTETVGAGAPRSQIDQIMTELRNAEAQLEQFIADQRLLEEALADPASYIVAPGSLLNSQPGLKKLREGLADAQLNSSALRGKFTDAHPLVVAAQDAQSTIEKRLIQTLEGSRVNLLQDIATCKKRIDLLNEQKRNAEDRLDSLAGVRTQYSNLVSELKTRTTILEDTERQLAEAYASKESALKVSLLTLLDEPIVGDRPVGPGRTTLVALFSAAGLLLGLGFVFAITPIDGMPRFGRRATDRISTDQRQARPETTPMPSVTEETPVNRTNDKLADLVRNAKRPRSKIVDDAITDRPIIDEKRTQEAVESFMAPAAEYEPITTEVADEPIPEPVEVENSSLTILERLAKAQEAFEDSERSSDETKSRYESVRPSLISATTPERRNNRRGPVKQTPQLDAVYRPRQE